MLAEELQNKTNSAVQEKIDVIKEKMEEEASKGNKLLVVSTTDDAENMQIIQYFRQEGINAKVRYRRDIPYLICDWSQKKRSWLQRVIDTLYVHISCDKTHKKGFSDHGRPGSLRRDGLPPEKAGE